ncbi:DUF1257 domain-containing protein [Cyanobium sp. Morenito 9A2]|uniref:DUF1257 domain-containing protein n=1 Tax=Cyanobium sp. Morenito 9A2 TaxID=2823718 RepID=UPI0020CF4085|nr:DUF1257 domain-containing protein [Cyanobium sp. Morenito 9A2]MCP9850089.1 DUF1257 domain-containing protein [Cyanobium sp. Morenito 9A2]
MSHLSILPTVLRDTRLLAASLVELGFEPHWGGALSGFAGDTEAVELQVWIGSDLALGWRRQPNGELALVGDLQRLSRSHQVGPLLGRLTRSYAARSALRDAGRLLPTASVQLSR